MSDSRNRQGQARQAAYGESHPLAELSHRIAEARRSGDPAPEELERLVGLLSRQDAQPEDRLARALDSLARWSDTARHEVHEPDHYAEEPRRPEPRREAYQPEPRREAPQPAPQQGMSLRSALAQISARQTELEQPREWAPAPRDRQPEPRAERQPEPARRPAAPEPRWSEPQPYAADQQRDMNRWAQDDDRHPAPQPRYQQPAEERYAAPPPPRVEKVDPAVFAEMRAEIEKLGRGVGDLPTRIQIEGLSRAVATLTGRLGEKLPASLDTDSLRAIDALVGEVDRMRTDAASPQMIRDLGEELKAISARLDVLGPRNAGAIDALARRIEDVRSELQHFPQVSAVDMLGAQINALALRFEAQERAAAPAREAVIGLAGRVASIDDKLDAFAEADRARGDQLMRMNESFRAELENLPRANAMSALGRQIDALTEGLKSQRPAAPQPSVTAFKDLTGKFDALDGKIERLAAAAPRSDAFEAIDRQIQSLAASIAAKPKEAPAFPKAIVEQVERLHGRMESVAQTVEMRNSAFDRVEEAVRVIANELAANRAPLPQAGDANPSAIETQVDRLVSGLERHDGRLDDLGAAFAGLAARIEQSCAQLGGDAARIAAEQASKALGAPSGPDMRMEVAEILSEMRSAASQSERRTADTLDAVRMTLERLLERMDDRPLSPARPPFADAPRVEPEPVRQRPAAAAAIAPELDATEAARAAARRAMEEIASQPTRAPMRRADAPVHQTHDDLGDDRPLEPGRGSSAPSTASLIAAARRATTAPVVEDEPVAAKVKRPKRVETPAGEKAPSALGAQLTSLKSKKRPLIVGLAAALIVLAALYVASGMTGGAPEPAAEAPAVEQQAPRQSSSLERPAIEKQERVAAANAGSRSSVIKPRDEAPPPEEMAYVETEEVPAATQEAPLNAQVAGPRATPSDLAGYAFDPASRSQAKQEWKTPEPLVTGSFTKPGDNTGLPVGIPPSVRTRATQGEAVAQLEVGARLLEGRGVEANPQAAKTWLEKAAAQGSAPAQHRLGSMYEKGNGVTKDVAAARRWYEQAAASGNVRAMHNLGVIHAEGSLGKADFNAASVWFRMAADRGLVDSQYNLAILDVRGLGGKKDLSEAYKWFSLAAAQGDADAGKKRDEVGKILGSDLQLAKSSLAAFRVRPIDPAANETPFTGATASR